MGLKDIHKKAEGIWEKLRLRTHILAIKLLRDVNDMPKGAKRPIKDLGYHLDLCQGFAMSRWAGGPLPCLKKICGVLSRL